jgi:hypothetical protein
MYLREISDLGLFKKKEKSLSPIFLGIQTSRSVNKKLLMIVLSKVLFKTQAGAALLDIYIWNWKVVLGYHILSNMAAKSMSTLAPSINSSKDIFPSEFVSTRSNI